MPRERPYVMEPVRKANDEYSGIFCSCHEKFSQTLGVPLKTAIFEFSQLGNPVDQEKIPSPNSF